MTSDVERLFLEVKSLFLAAREDMTGRKDAVFVWTSQGIVPQLNMCDEVYRNIYLGDNKLSRDIKTLKRMGISLMVNAAEGTEPSQLAMDPRAYTSEGIGYVGVPAFDNLNFKMTPYFRSVCQMIHNFLKQGERVYVFCQQGRSRSATLVLAYLIMYERMRLKQALTTVRQRRQVTPNDGFLRELCQLEIDIRKSTTVLS